MSSVEPLKRALAHAAPARPIEAAYGSKGQLHLSSSTPLTPFSRPTTSSGIINAFSLPVHYRFVSFCCRLCAFLILFRIYIFIVLLRSRCYRPAVSLAFILLFSSSSSSFFFSSFKMSNPNALYLLADHIKLSLLERQRAKALDLLQDDDAVAAAGSGDAQDGHIARSLEQLEEGIAFMKREQERLQAEGQEGYVCFLFFFFFSCRLSKKSRNPPKEPC